MWLDPILNGRYPADVLEDTREISDWSFVQPGDLEIISRPIDLLGVNYYQPNLVRAYDGVRRAFPRRRSRPRRCHVAWC